MSFDAVRFLENTIRIPSTSGEEKAVATYLMHTVTAFADETFVDDSTSFVAHFKGGTGPNILFLGHIDTVPGNIKVRTEDGNLYGRGVVDAKGSTCTALTAAIELVNEGHKLNFTVIGASEEEAPTSKGARFALENYENPDLLIIGEPSNWDAITLGYKGRLVLKVTREKENFHSAGNDTTAAEDMLPLWNDLVTWNEEQNKDAKGIFDAIQLALQSINTESDGMTQSCKASFGFRLPPAYPPERVMELIQPILSNYDVTVEPTGMEQPYRGPKDTELTRAFRVAIREHGGKPRFKVKTGTSDMNVVMPHWDVPVLAYGPGDSALDHTPHEHLELAEYEKAIAVFKTALLRLQN